MSEHDVEEPDITSREELMVKLREEIKAELMRELREEEAEQEERAEKDYPWLVFGLDETEYAINSKFVLSIEILGEITPIVDSENHCPGITRSRGELIELLDLRALFGLGNYVSAKTDSADDRYMMVVIETGGIKRGMIVDQIVSVEYITDFVSGVIGEIEGAITSRYVSQVAKREKTDSPVLILRPESLGKLI